jgi:pimeloyl-ACP methyl ester carboxylesterase
MPFTPAHRGGSGPPLVLIHGFLDTWRVWQLVLPAVERRRDVLAPTLAGHAGGPPLTDVSADAVVDAVEAAMDAAGFETAYVAGSSLGGYVALRLAARGRARSVVAFAPAGGYADVLELQTGMQEQARAAAPHAHALLATNAGRRRATELLTVNYDHIPVDVLVHQLLGVARCDAAEAMIARAREHGWPLEPERITCPVRIVWGTEDRLLPYPAAAERFRRELPQADWVELDGVGHYPQWDVPLETAELILGFT